MARPVNQAAKDIAQYQDILKKLRAAEAVLTGKEFADTSNIVKATIAEVKARIVDLL